MISPPPPPRPRPRALTPAQLADLAEVRARVALAVTAARRAGLAQPVVLAMVARSYEDAEALERGAQLAEVSGAPAGGDRRGPRRGGRG